MTYIRLVKINGDNAAQVCRLHRKFVSFFVQYFPYLFSNGQYINCARSLIVKKYIVHYSLTMALHPMMILLAMILLAMLYVFSILKYLLFARRRECKVKHI